jgi:hypothetical protein
LTILGTVIGLAALVATLGISQTAGNRIVGRFDELAATEVYVTSRPPSLDAPDNDMPWDSPERLRRLNGVVAAGNLSVLDVGEALVSTSPLRDPTQRTEFKLSVQAISPGLYEAVRAVLNTGRLTDQLQSDRAERVAVLGKTRRRAARHHTASISSRIRWATSCSDHRDHRRMSARQLISWRQ